MLLRKGAALIAPRPADCAGGPREASGSRRAKIRSQTSMRCTGTSGSISKPSLTRWPQISITVTRRMRSKPVEPPTTTDSWLFLDRTNIVESPFSGCFLISTAPHNAAASAGETKKAGVLKDLQVFDHAGLLVNGPPVKECPLISSPTARTLSHGQPHRGLGIDFTAERTVVKQVSKVFSTCYDRWRVRRFPGIRRFRLALETVRACTNAKNSRRNRSRDLRWDNAL
jgi:hypothetical protein